MPVILKSKMISLILMFIFVSAVFSAPEITPGLNAKIRQLSQNDTISAWIFFTDKGPHWQTDLISAKANFTQRALQRRQKNRNSNKLLDFYDLPVKKEYIQIISQMGIKIRHKSRWLNAISVELPLAKIEQIKQLSFIKKLDVLTRYRSLPEPEETSVLAPDNLQSETHRYEYGNSYIQNNQINVPALHDLGYSGAGVLIASLDAGFDNLRHESLLPVNILQTWDFVNGDSSVADDPGQMGHGSHGTKTLGTLAAFDSGKLIGPAFGADFILAKTENSDSEMHIEEDYWIAAAEWADSLGADIISSSLGYRDGFSNGDSNYAWQDMDGETTIVVKGADIAASRGILVVNSVGNGGEATSSNPNTIISPADGDSVLSVGAVYSNGLRGDFSSVGPTTDGRIKPEVMAKGSGVIVPVSYNTVDYQLSAGTSLSCPLVAGAAALVWEANPGLSNMQIMEALKNTASNKDAPNNEMGWGIVDAFAAAYYYRPLILHSPLPDTENLHGPYTIDVKISSTFPLKTDSLKVLYRFKAGPFQAVDLIYISEEQYRAEIPGPGTITEVQYYISAQTDSGFVTTSPEKAPSQLYHFFVEQDITAPVITHTPIQKAAVHFWPVAVQAEITDNIGIDTSHVFVEWNINGVAQQSFNLHHFPNHQFRGKFLGDSTSIDAGDIVQYRIVAKDMAANSNTAKLPKQGFFQFELSQTRGFILLIDDESGVSRSLTDREGNVVVLPDSFSTASEQMQHYLQDLGYSVTMEYAAFTDLKLWNQYQLVISSSGENMHPLNFKSHRDAIVDYVESGGNLLIEGGEVGYVSAKGPGYPAIAENVLHSTTWNGDVKGPLFKTFGGTNHPICNYPHVLGSRIDLEYNSLNGYYDQDAMFPGENCKLIYQAQNAIGHAGILLYRDNANPVSAQVVYFAFDFSSIIDTLLAKNLLENTVEYLIADGNIIDIEEQTRSLASTIQLFANYPNPFNPETKIKFYLSNREKVQLSVYNILGQKVQQLASGKFAPGFHEINWNASKFASGIYYIVLQTSGQRHVQKAILLN